MIALLDKASTEHRAPSGRGRRDHGYCMIDGRDAGTRRRGPSRGGRLDSQPQRPMVRGPDAFFDNFIQGGQ